MLLEITPTFHKHLETQGPTIHVSQGVAFDCPREATKRTRSHGAPGHEYALNTQYADVGRSTQDVGSNPGAVTGRLSTLQISQHHSGVCTRAVEGEDNNRWMNLIVVWCRI